MFSIPKTYADDNEDYITLLPLKKFAKEFGEGVVHTTSSRQEAISEIEEYANKSTNNCEIVKSWLDGVLTEGIKELQIRFFNYAEGVSREGFLEMAQEKLEDILVDKDNRHYCNHFSPELRLFRYDIMDIPAGEKVIRLYMGKLLSVLNDKETVSAVHYPIFLEIYTDSRMIVVRAKPKSNLFKYQKDFVVDALESTTVEKELKNAVNYIVTMFEMLLYKPVDAQYIHKSNLYKMLNKYTDTPPEIEALMREHQNDVDSMVDNMIETCGLSKAYKDDVKADINNMIEKYFSISYPDKNIFTVNRAIYPLHLIATDEEESRVEQTAGMEEPLQSKAIFFDNKKMLQKSKMCDGVSFVCKRNDSRYSSTTFKVKITTKMDFCVMKLTEYTAEEDIVNVLFTLTHPGRTAE